MTPQTHRGQRLSYHSPSMGWCTWQQPYEPYTVAWEQQNADAAAPMPQWEEHAFYAAWRNRWHYFYYDIKTGVSTWQRPWDAYIPCFEQMHSPFPARWRPAY